MMFFAVSLAWLGLCCYLATVCDEFKFASVFTWLAHMIAQKIKHRPIEYTLKVWATVRGTKLRIADTLLLFTAPYVVMAIYLVHFMIELLHAIGR